MRLLILLRGLPGIGKSTWVKNNKLEGAVLCADDVRLMFSGPVRDPSSGTWDIDQKYNKEVFKFIHARLIERMYRGETIVMDEQNIDITNYKQLAERFAYDLLVVQFPIDKEKALQQNAHRLPVYKRVPEYVIEKSFNKMKQTPLPAGVKVLTPDQCVMAYLGYNDVTDMITDYPDLDKRFPDGCVFFGDIHGCLQPLQSYFSKHMFSDRKLYVFLGDYLDRGPQNGETLEFLIQLSKKPNCVFLEGNHFWERFYAKGDTESIKSDEFLQYTVPQISHIPKADILDFCNTWKPFFCFKYGSETYFCSHAGFGYVPDDIIHMPLSEFIKGHHYSDDVDAWYNAYEYEDKPVQIHGHRNQYHYAPDKFQDSINLCSPIEFGGPLQVLEVDTAGHRQFFTVENTLGNSLRRNLRIDVKAEKPERCKATQFLIDLRRHNKEIKEKVLDNGVSSFNFSRDVFFKQNWSDISKVARGLFLDSTTGAVVARSWPKFFNWGEYEVTEEYIKEHMEFPVQVFTKYNGYLGLLSVHKGELFFASKTTTEGPYAENFKRIFYEQVSPENVYAVQQFLAENGATMLFEVIDPVNDPHIIEYDKAELILLDIMAGQITEDTVKYGTLQDVARRFGFKYKNLDYICKTWSDLVMFKDIVTDSSCISRIEGFVLEGKNKFRVKLKTPFYNLWKKIRRIKERISAELEVITTGMSEEERNIYDFMCTNISKEELKNMSVIEVRNQYEKAIQKEL